MPKSKPQQLNLLDLIPTPKPIASSSDDFKPNIQIKVNDGKHKSKLGTVKEVNKTQVCCHIEQSFYMWYFPESLTII